MNPLERQVQHAADVAHAEPALVQLDGGEAQGLLGFPLGGVEALARRTGLRDERLERCVELDVDGDLDAVGAF